MNQKIISILTASIFVLTAATFVFAGDPGVISSGVGVVVNAGGTGSSSPSSGSVCGNNMTSCGTYPDCQNLTALPTCVSGHQATNYCFSNSPKVSLKSSTCGNSTPQNGSDISIGQTYSINLNVTDEDDEDQAIHVELFKPGTSEMISQSDLIGSGTFSTKQGTLDLDFNFNDELHVKVKGLDAAHFGSDYKKVVVNGMAAEMSNADVLKSFKVELPSGLSYSTIFLKIKFDDVFYDNINKLYIYKCSSASYDPETNTCKVAWTKLVPTIDSANKIASVEINSFSVFALAEDTSSSIDTTTTTTLQTTTTEQSTGTTQTNSQSSSSSSNPNFNENTFGETTTEQSLQDNTYPPVEIVVAKEPENESTTTTQSEAKSTSLPISISSGLIELILAALIIPSIVTSLYFYKKSHLPHPHYIRRNYRRNYRSTHRGQRPLRIPKTDMNETILILN